jgi:hypothetical protein
VAGRKPSGKVSSVYAGGFGPTKFEGKHRKREASREWTHLEHEVIRYAVAYRLEEYFQAGKLTAMLNGHPRREYCRTLRKKGMRGDVLHKLRGKITWVWRGPIDKPHVYYTDLKTKFMQGTDWLHHTVIRDRSLWQILESLELPRL